MKHTLRIATWNIAGARKMSSLDKFDYSDEDIQYFADCLAAIDPDVVCLQESHTSEAHSVAHALAAKLQMPFVHNDVVSVSHIDAAYQLGNAVISKFDLRHVKNVTYPYPPFGDVLANGKPSKHHDKMLQIFAYEGLTLANTQMQPLGIFNKTYDEGEGLLLAHDIDRVLTANLKSPLVLCGDINFNDPKRIYPGFFKAYNLRDALPDELTRPNKEGIKKTPDHIIVSSEVTVDKAEIVHVQADHYLCFADIRF